MDIIEIKDQHIDALREAVVGRKITEITREPSPKREDGEFPWEIGQNSVEITLDDGSVLYFYGWGYDASGVELSYQGPELAKIKSTEVD